MLRGEWSFVWLNWAFLSPGQPSMDYRLVALHQTSENSSLSDDLQQGLNFIFFVTGFSTIWICYFSICNTCVSVKFVETALLVWLTSNDYLSSITIYMYLGCYFRVK